MQGIKCNALHHWKVQIILNKTYHTLLEGETFLRNKHEIAFFETKCTFFGRKENTINGLSERKGSFNKLHSSTSIEKSLGEQNLRV